jgi:hypothetical protein
MFNDLGCRDERECVSTSRVDTTVIRWLISVVIATGLFNEATGRRSTMSCLDNEE